MKKEIYCGNVKIGGGAPPSIQSMLNVHTERIDDCLNQIARLKEVGCQIVRLAIPNMEAAKAFKAIKEGTDLPLVADIHFDYKLAIAAIEAGADKVRINPGNIGNREKIKAVVDAAKKASIPIRVGVNSGSLEKGILEKNKGVTWEGLVESALRNVKILEDLNFYDIAISIKASDVVTTVKAYRQIDKLCDYPLHIGVTEAGTKETGIIKSSVGIGSLLLDGIGDTIRVSLTGDPVDEVIAGEKILAACGIRKEPINIVSCPTCGRTRVNLEEIISKVEARLAPIAKAREEAGKKPITVAVMGCEVNGPGEAKEADLGVAGGDGRGVLFKKGKVIKSVDEKDIEDELIRMVLEYEDA